MYDYHVEIYVNKGIVLTKLVENRKRYVNSMDALKAAWKEASDKYKENYQKWETKYVAETLTNEDRKPNPPAKIEDRTEDYDLWIEMLTISIKDQIRLNKEHYDMLYRDNWNWMGGHKNTVHRYAIGEIGAFSINTNTMLADSVRAYNIST